MIDAPRQSQATYFVTHTSSTKQTTVLLNSNYDNDDDNDDNDDDF